MLTATLLRKEYGDAGTFGELVVKNDRGEHITLCTGELPWRHNEPEFSCVPSGAYHCALEYSAHFTKTLWELKDVPHRSDAKIHNANFCGDSRRGLRCQLLGCIAVGMSTGPLYGQPAVLSSVAALHLLMEFTKDDTAMLLTIKGDPAQEPTA